MKSGDSVSLLTISHTYCCLSTLSAAVLCKTTAEELIRSLSYMWLNPLTFKQKAIMPRNRRSGHPLAVNVKSESEQQQHLLFWFFVFKCVKFPRMFVTGLVTAQQTSQGAALSVWHRHGRRLFSASPSASLSFLPQSFPYDLNWANLMRCSD